MKGGRSGRAKERCIIGVLNGWTLDLGVLASPVAAFLLIYGSRSYSHECDTNSQKHARHILIIGDYIKPAIP